MSLVRGLIQRVFDELIHGRDSTAACDTETLVESVGFVLVLDNRAFEQQRLSYGKIGNVRGELSVLTSVLITDSQLALYSLTSNVSLPVSSGGEIGV